MVFLLHLTQIIIVVIMFRLLYEFKDALGNHLNEDDPPQKN